MSNHPNRFLVSTIAIFVIAFLVPLTIHSSTSAQESDDSWSTPVNLSASGATTDPVMVVDSNSVFHVIWKDEFAGYIYTTGDGETWSAPTPVQLPSEDYQPWLFADKNGWIHEFWIDANNQLFHSRVNASNFATGSSWTGAEMLSDSAVTLDVAVGPSGQLHLGYVRILSTTDFPAGLYYRKYLTDGGSWLSPVKLYESLYFRTLDAETGHVDVTATGASDVDQVYVAWDNRPRSRVFFTRSTDGGETWDEPRVVDQPQVGEGVFIPTNIVVHARDDRVLLLWNKGSTDEACVNYYQWSEDLGGNWQPPDELFGDPALGSVISCPESIQVIDGDERLYLLVKSIQMYLVAWDGARWSDPQGQAALSSFIDEDTQNVVEFGCQQAVMRPEDRLGVVGCDTALGGDTWFMERQITSIEGWFPQEPVWSSPAQLVEGETQILQPVLASDPGNQIHAFWSQINSAVTDNQNEVIFYARLETGGQWTKPEEILRIPEESLRQPAVAVDSNGNLLLVWTGMQSGKIFFSTVAANQAVIPTAWSNPVPLPSPLSSASSPDIFIGPDGTISVVYAVPLNQARGIYLVQSGDGGLTWSDPVLLFDAESAGLSMVDNPHLTIMQNNHIHVIWTEYSLPSGPGPLALYHIRSEDNGASWSEPELVIDKQVPWSEIISIGDQSLHRLWQEVGGGITLWHDYSTDGGNTWTRISPVSIFNERVSSSEVVVDGTGRLNLLQVVNRGGGSFVLQHWVWVNQVWRSEENLILERTVATNIDHLAADLTSSGELGVIFSSREISVDTDDQLDSLSFSQRTIEGSPTGSPGETPAETSSPPTPTPPPLPTATLAPEETDEAPTTETTSEPTPAPTNTPDLGSTPVNTGGPFGISGVYVLIGGLVVLVVAGMAVAAWFFRRNRVYS